jgi:S1-C subfamily serine protease
MTSLPPPAPGVSPGLPSPTHRRAAPAPKRRNWAVVVAVGVVAWTAGLTGALVGNQVSDWIDSPPRSASDEPINVSEPSGPIEGRLDVAKVIGHMAASVVTISADVDSEFGRGQSTGTGVIVSSDGEILTNAHVVEGAPRSASASPARPSRARRVCSPADPGNDLALLRMSGDGFDAAVFADPGSVRIGDEVVAIGFALGLDGDSVGHARHRVGARPHHRHRRGVPRRPHPDRRRDLVRQLRRPAGQRRGEVVGINTAVARDTATSAATNVGFAISAREALPVIEALRAQSGGDPRTEGYLGVELGERRDGGQGAVIQAVQDDTPAAEAGIEAGDLVVAADGAPIDGATGLIAAIRDLGPGDSTTLTLMRDGESIDITVTLVERPGD